MVGPRTLALFLLGWAIARPAAASTGLTGAWGGARGELEAAGVVLPSATSRTSSAPSTAASSGPSTGWACSWSASTSTGRAWWAGRAPSSVFMASGATAGARAATPSATTRRRQHRGARGLHDHRGVAAAALGPRRAARRPACPRYELRPHARERRVRAQLARHRRRLRQQRPQRPLDLPREQPRGAGHPAPRRGLGPARRRRGPSPRRPPPTSTASIRAGTRATAP